MIDETVLVKANLELTEILQGVDPKNVCNFDESSIPLSVIGEYSWEKKSKTTTARACSSEINKQRVTVACFVNQNGDRMWKSLVVDRSFTTGLQCLNVSTF